jgi:hypothetical protein
MKVEPTLLGRNQRWRKSHQNKNLKAPHPKGCENGKTFRVLTEDVTDRQSFIGIQIGSNSVYMPSCHPFKSFGDY